MKVLDNREDAYSGIIRGWCVGRIKCEDILIDDASVPDKWIELDFGKPRTDGRTYRSEESNSVSRHDMEEVVKKITRGLMTSGYRGDIVTEVIRKLNAEYEVEVEFKAYSKAGDWTSHSFIRLVEKGKGVYEDEEIATAEDIKPYLSENEYDVKIKVTPYTYYTSQKRYNGEDGIKYIANKVLKEEYTYCLKKGKNIVPDKYIANGADGIIIWQSEKKNSNKNNSIEKQMLKSIKIEKKQMAFNKFCKVMEELEGRNRDWTMVFLTIDGRWNTSRRVKTINKYILNVTDDELIKMSEEEIEKRCKSYWTARLMEAQARIKALKFEA